MRVLGIITLLLLTVTALGIFGTTSFSVTQRTKQIGTRRALGASRSEIVRYFLVENSLIAAMGIALGLVGAMGLNVFLVTNFPGGIDSGARRRRRAAALAGGGGGDDCAGAARLVAFSGAGDADCLSESPPHSPNPSPTRKV